MTKLGTCRPEATTGPQRVSFGVPELSHHGPGGRFRNPWPDAEPRSGRAEGGAAPLEMLRPVARAAADAVSAGHGSQGAVVRVRGIQQVEAFGQVVIIVSLAATRAGKSQTLLGVCDGSRDLARAAALAVLNAANRFLGVG